MSKNVFKNEDVEHSFNCCSTECFLSNRKHVGIFTFETKSTAYHAETLDEAAEMWIEGGKEKLISVNSLG